MNVDCINLAPNTSAPLKIIKEVKEVKKNMSFKVYFEVKSNLRALKIAIYNRVMIS